MRHCESAACDLLSPLLAMRRHISVELKKVALRLALVKGYKYKKIRKIMRISERSTRCLCALYQHTGDVVRRRVVDGRPRVLNGFELSVSGIYLNLVGLTSNTFAAS